MVEAQAVSSIFGDPALPRHRRLHLEACRVPGAWLTANLSSGDSHVSSALFRVALQRRLRMPIRDHDSACDMPQRCPRRGLLRKCRIHLCLSGIGETWSPPEAPTSTTTPPLGLLAAGRRPAEIWVPRGVSGFAEAWDLSVSSLLRTFHFSSATPSVADVFQEVEARKRAFQDTASMVAERGATFCPLVLEACGGGWSQAFRGVVAWIASESRTARGLSTDLPRDTSLRDTAHQLHPSQGKRACNPEAFSRVCQRSSGLVGDQVPASGWCDLRLCQFLVFLLFWCSFVVCLVVVPLCRLCWCGAPSVAVGPPYVFV